MRALLDILLNAGRGMVDETGFHLALIRGAWRRTVGETIDSKTKLTSWSGRTLQVVCADRTWQKQLDLLRPEILRKLDCLGRQAPLDIRFTVENDPPRPKRIRGGRPKNISQSRKAQTSVVKKSTVSASRKKRVK